MSRTHQKDSPRRNSGRNRHRGEFYSVIANGSAEAINLPHHVALKTVLRYRRDLGVMAYIEVSDPSHQFIEGAVNITR